MHLTNVAGDQGPCFMSQQGIASGPSLCNVHVPYFEWEADTFQEHLHCAVCSTLAVSARGKVTLQQYLWADLARFMSIPGFTSQ